VQAKKVADKVPLPPASNPVYGRSYTHTFIFGGAESGEGGDRGDLTWNQDVFDHLTRFKHTGKVIGAAVGPGPLDLRNLTGAAHAVFFNIMPGARYSQAVADLVFGRANPSAKLSTTLPTCRAQLNFTDAQYPGIPDGGNVSYSEKHHFGYRFFDQQKLEPLFPFGHGLGYSKFEYADLHIRDKTVSLTVTNAGKMKGSEVVQVYLEVPETENFYGGYRSPKVLKQFVKVKDLKPNESRRVSMTLDDRAFSYWNTHQVKWVVEPGKYGVHVGASSRDIRLVGGIEIRH
jgi:beta-glucosidase